MVTVLKMGNKVSPVNALENAMDMAVEECVARKFGGRLPLGKRNPNGIWLPLSGVEHRDCCAEIHSVWAPHMHNHCCSYGHVARLYAVDLDSLQRISSSRIRQLKILESCVRDEFSRFHYHWENTNMIVKTENMIVELSDDRPWGYRIQVGTNRGKVARFTDIGDVSQYLSRLVAATHSNH